MSLFTHTGRLSMAWKRLGWSLLSPTCLGGYRIFGRSMTPNINARGCWDRRSPWRGCFTLQHPAP